MTGIDILMITHRRPHYTRRTLAALLAECDRTMRVWLWHNGPDAETLEVVRGLADHAVVADLHVSPENMGLREPTNWMWSRARGRYLSKVDDDCLLEPGWAGALRDAHERNPGLGVLGCWRFQDDDYVPELAAPRIEPLEGGARVLRNTWVQGSGYLMKRACYEQQGPLREGETFTTYCRRLALRGWVNGFHVPFLREDHMDDPRSPNSGLRRDEDLRRFAPLSAAGGGTLSLEDWTARVRANALAVQTSPLDARWYFGWRGRAWRLRERLARVARASRP